MHRAHYIGRTAGAAALLPALLLAALYVAAPFAGTTTHAIADRTAIAATAYVSQPVPGERRLFE